MQRAMLRCAAVIASLALLPAPGRASFHLMQIEQVLGGACGDPTQQAIQLRMRASGQNLVSGRQLIAHDDEGLQPVVLITFPANVSISAAGSRILVTTAELSGSYGPNPDFTLTTPIPPSYLPAGRLTFEDGFGTIYWSLSWGGASYTGPNSGNTDNDADGNFGPPFGGVLPSALTDALQFQGAAGSLSTNNAADYAVTVGGATLTNNAGTAQQVVGCLVFVDGFESGDLQGWSISVP